MNHNSEKLMCVFIAVITIGCAGYICASGNSISAIKRAELNRVARETISAEHIPAGQRLRLLNGYLADSTLSNDTRRLAALALSRMGEPAAVESVPRLVRQLGDKDRTVIVWSAKALGKFGPLAADAAPALISLLDHSDAAPRNASIEALAQIGSSHPTVIPALVERIVQWRTTQSPDLLESLEYVMDGLGQIGSDAASCIPALLRTVELRHERIRISSVAALGQMGPTADIAVPALVERLVFDDSAAVRDVAVTAISKVGPPAVPQLAKALRANDDQARIAAITALALIGTPARAQLPTLISATEDSSAEVALAAARAVQSVSAGGIDVSPILLRSLADSDRQVRMQAARMFSTIGPHGKTSTVRKALNDLLKSANPGAKQAASKVLRDLFQQ